MYLMRSSGKRLWLSALPTGDKFDMRLFLDTNILIDLFWDYRADHPKAARLKAAYEFSDLELYCSAKSYTDVFYVMRKEKEPSSVIQDIFLESADYLEICAVNREDIVAAARCKWGDFEDCLIDVCACKCGADAIITRDASGFTRSKLPVYDVDGFFRFIQDEYGVVYDEIELD